jgi:integrase
MSSRVARMRKGLIDSNPFSHLKSTTLASPEKFYFVTRIEADAVLDACPDAQWRLIFALGRFGGFRCPSEHLALRWDDIDWENDRMVVHSPKTEHHVGRPHGPSHCFRSSNPCSWTPWSYPTLTTPTSSREIEMGQ